MTQANGILTSLISNKLFVSFLEKLETGSKRTNKHIYFLRDMLQCHNIRKQWHKPMEQTNHWTTCERKQRLRYADSCLVLKHRFQSYAYLSDETCNGGRKIRP